MLRGDEKIDRFLRRCKQLGIVRQRVSLAEHDCRLAMRVHRAVTAIVGAGQTPVFSLMSYEPHQPAIDGLTILVVAAMGEAGSEKRQ